MSQKLFFYAVISTIFLAACGKSGDRPEAQETPASPQKAVTAEKAGEVVWYTDWDKGMEAAKRENKPAIVDFYTDWCMYCKKMEQETFSAPSVKDRLSKNWVTIRINAEDQSKYGTIEGKKMSNAEITRNFGVTGFPTILFIDKEHKPVHPLPGFVPADPFSIILDYFKDEEYKNKVNLNDYVKSKTNN